MPHSITNTGKKRLLKLKNNGRRRLLVKSIKSLSQLPVDLFWEEVAVCLQTPPTPDRGVQSPDQTWDKTHLHDNLSILSLIDMILSVSVNQSASLY